MSDSDLISDGDFTSVGYFIARDPCVAFLYVLIGIKFLEARGARDGALLVCLALFLALTQFFYAQTILAALAALPALLATGVALAVLRTPTDATERWRPHLRATVRLILQGIPGWEPAKQGTAAGSEVSVNADGGGTPSAKSRSPSPKR